MPRYGKCPFWDYNGAACIHGECGCVLFDSARARRAYFERFCAEQYALCARYRRILRRYERKGL